MSSRRPGRRWTQRYAASLSSAVKEIVSQLPASALVIRIIRILADGAVGIGSEGHADEALTARGSRLLGGQHHPSCGVEAADEMADGTGRIHPHLVPLAVGGAWYTPDNAPGEWTENWFGSIDDVSVYQGAMNAVQVRTTIGLGFDDES